MHPTAARRILRLAAGTSACLFLAELVQWPLAYVAAILCSVILSLPIPKLGLRKSLVLWCALVVPLVASSTLLVPFLLHMRSVAILLIALVLFYIFYFTVRQQQQALGTFMLIAMSVVVTIGSVQSAVLPAIIQGISLSGMLGIFCAGLAFALFPDVQPDEGQPGAANPQATPAIDATRLALRGLVVMLPLVIVFLFTADSASYMVVMIKVAAMAQQASGERSRMMGLSLLASTLLGCLGALAIWFVLAMAPSLLLYVLLVCLAGLVYGRWIFHGQAVHPRFQLGKYAYLTALVIIAPAVSQGLDASAMEAVVSRIGLFLIVALYGTVAIGLFDRLWSVPGDSTSHRGALYRLISPRASVSEGSSPNTLR